MSTLLLSLLLIALVAIGLLMAAKPVREMFVNPTSSTIASTVISAASPTLVSLTATPTLTAQSPQVDTLGRDQSLQKATDAGSASAPYSDVGVGDESSIRSWADLTPTENSFIKDIVIKAHGDATAPLNPQEVVLVAMFRKAGKTVIASMEKGDSSIDANSHLTIEEYALVHSMRDTNGIVAKGPLSDAERAMIVNRRKAFLAKQGPAAAAGLSLSSDETAAVLRMRKAAEIKKARSLLAQEEEPVNSNPARRQKAKADEDYEDDYSGYASVAPSQRRRMTRKPEADDCPDMSQYIKLDEIPCWNCSLP